MPIRSIKANDRLCRILFFLIAGGTGFALYLIISDTLHYLFHVSEVISAAVGTLLPIFPTFWMQKKFTFRSRDSHKLALPGYFLLQVCNAVLITSLTALGARIGMPGMVIFPLSGVIGAMISYFIQARLIFRTIV